MMKLPFSALHLVVFLVLVPAGGALAAEADRWMLMSRHGECVSLADAARRLPELRGVSDPQAFAARLRDAGEAVRIVKHPAGGGRIIQVTAPSRGLAMVFVSEIQCRTIETR